MDAYQQQPNIAVSTNQNTAIYLKAYALFNQKDYTAAESVFRSYVQVIADKDNTTYPDALNRIADCLFYVRNFQEASDIYAQVSKLNGYGADYAIMQNGYAQGLMHHYEQKEEVLTSLTELYPRSDYADDALYEIARAQLQQDQNEEAINTYQSLLQKYPKSNQAAKSSLELGMTYRTLKQYDNATSTFKTTIERYAGTEEAYAALEGLEQVYVETNNIEEYIAYDGYAALAKALADYLFNDETMMTRIDMSEYQEKYSVSRLIGAPPGYIGYDEGGQLTEAVRRKPYSVVLFDEIEKAHPDVFNILLQVLDDGRLTDNKGRTVDFKNTILIMTSNVGADIIQNYMESSPEFLSDQCKADVLEVLKRTVRPEFLNRIDEVIMFEPLSQNDIRDILKMQIVDLKEKLGENGVTISFTKGFEDYMCTKGYEQAYGARPIKRLMQKELVNMLAKAILDGSVSRASIINIDVVDGKIVIS